MNPLRTLVLMTIIILVFRSHLDVDNIAVSVFLHDMIAVMLIFSAISFGYVKKGDIFSNQHSIYITILLLLALIFPFSAYPGGFVLNYLRLVYYVFVFIALFSLLNAYNVSFWHISRVLNGVIVANAIVVLVQIVEPDVLFELFSFIFGSDKLKGFGFGAPRVYGAFMNVNWAGVAYSLLLIVIFTELRFGIISLKYFTILFLMLAFMLAMTGSRTGFLAFSMALVSWLLVYRHWFWLGLTVSVPSAYLFLWDPASLQALGRFAELYQALAGGGGILLIDTMVIRLETMQSGLELIYERPVTGWGDVDAVMHNSWITTAVNFGIIGLSLVVLLISLLLLYGLSTFEKKRIMFCMLIPFVSATFTGEYVYSTQVMSLLIILSVSLKCTTLQRL